MDYEELKLEHIAGGVAVNQVNYALGEVIENCLDPNTSATGARSVTLKLTISPTEDREKANISYKVDRKLQGDAPGDDTILISRSGKKGYLTTAKQMELEEFVKRQLDEEEVDEDGVVTMKGVEK